MTAGSRLGSAYGGAGWSPRIASLRDELGSLWGECGLSNEWSPLESVLLHRPGPEMEIIRDPRLVQMSAGLNPEKMRAQHDALSRVYREAGVTVRVVNPEVAPPPNLLFVADLLFLTPEGVILGRPASTVRAGEERFIARRLGELGIPILRSVRGTGTFEGADAMWVDDRTVLLATGIRTNSEGADQVSCQLAEMGIDVVRVGLPYGAMHLIGTIRVVDHDLAFAWPGRVPYEAVETLRKRGHTVTFIEDLDEVSRGFCLNFVTLGPRWIVMPKGNPAAQALYEAAGVSCITVEVDELQKACGSIACLTGVLKREGGLGIA